MALFGKKNIASGLERLIKYKFKNRKLLDEALTHRSVAKESPDEKNKTSNERLEYLGDAVLELTVAEYLFFKFQRLDEGELTEKRRVLVNREFLAKKARELSLGEFIKMSQGERESGGKARKSNLSNAYEALIGAIYLDGGMKSAKKFIEKIHLENIDQQFNSEESVNYKGALLERLQSKHKRPEFRLISETGPDHHKKFAVAVFVGGKEIGRGEGSSKKEAEQMASKNAFERGNID